MRCPNCGAGMKISARCDHLECDFCGGAHFPDENRDGVRSWDDPTGKKCPVCKGELSKGAIERISLEICQRCEGLLMNREDFTSVVQVRNALWSGQKLPPRPLDQKEGKRIISCPSCGKDMECHPYFGPGQIWMDSCINCHLVWLDRGELAVLEKS